MNGQTNSRATTLHDRSYRARGLICTALFSILLWTALTLSAGAGAGAGAVGDESVGEQTADARTSGNEPAESTAQAYMISGRQAFNATRYDQALADLETAAELFGKAGDAVGEATAELEIGLVLIEAGAMRRGLATIEQAVARLPEDVDRELQGRALVRLAQGKRGVGATQEAAQILDRAERVYQGISDNNGQAKIWAERSALASKAERWQEAATFASRAVGLAEDPEFRLGAMAHHSFALHQLGALEQAQRAYQEVLVSSKAQHDLRFVNFAYCNLADVSWKMGQARPALEDLWRALEGIERARSRIAGTPEERSAYLARQVAVYDRLIRFLVDTSNSRAAFNVAERFRARSFLEMLRSPEGTSAVQPSVDREQADRNDAPAEDDCAPEDQECAEADLEQQQQDVVQSLGRARLELQKQGSAAGRAAARRQVEALELELDRLRAARLGSLRSSEDGGIDRAKVGDISELQTALRPDEVLLAYWVSEQRTLVWVISSDNRILFQIPLSRDELSTAIDAYLEPLRFPRRAEDMAIRQQEDEHIARGRELYRWLIEPMPPWAHAAKRIIVIPDAELHKLPLEALIRTCDENPGSEPGAGDATDESLVHGAYRRCKFLGLEKALVYSPSAGTLLAIRRRADARISSVEGDTLLALAPSFEAPAELAAKVLPAELRASHLRGLAPLQHTRDEVERIAAQVPRALPLVGNDASEHRFKSEAGRFRFLHLATHGLVDDSMPMSSGVLLDDGQGEDGLLQANEILQMRLAAELVTLSACRTGRGRLRRGQGVVGLSRAFLFAGASSVAVSLWDVDDRSTPMLMETFYTRMADGSSQGEALRAARARLFAAETQTRLVHRERRLSYAHPRFWAGFVLIGSP